MGAAAIDSDGLIHVGCNIEHRFRAHDVHAEVNALSTMVASGGAQALAILVAAEREQFTPCGGCMDWIFELGGGGCHVGFQGRQDGPVTWWRALELMPHYPR